MLKVIGQISLAIFLVIVLLIVKCAIQSKMYNSDSVLQENLRKFKEQTGPLINSLEAYHSLKGYYPRSLNDLSLQKGQADSIDYVVTQFNRVYKSIDCREKLKQLQGTGMIDSRELDRKMKDFRNECVSGYSMYYLKSWSNWSSNNSTKIFGEFNSQNVQWNIAWCEYGNKGSKSGDCDEGESQ